MTRISMTLMHIMNLYNASLYHKTHCRNPDCGVSLFMLKQSAEILAKDVPITEAEEADKLIAAMPII